MLALAAILSIFVYGVSASILGTVMPSLALTAEQKGDVALTQGIGLVVASVFIGPLIDARGKKTGLILGLVCLTVSLFALGNVSDFNRVAAFFFLQGAGGGMIVAAANTLAGGIDERRRASVLNFVNLFFGLGGLLTPLLAANLFHDDRVKVLYFAAELATLTLLLLIFTRIPGPVRAVDATSNDWSVVLRRPVLFWFGLLLFLYVACEVGVWNWLKQYLITSGIDPKTAGNILSLGFALGILVGRVVVARFLARVPSLTVTLAAAVCMAVTTTAMLFAGSAVGAGVAVFFAGVAMAPVFPTTLAMVGDAFPHRTATAMGLVITCSWIGLSVSSPIIGAVAGPDSSNLRNALLLIPAFSVAMIGVNLVLRRMLRPAVA